MGRASRLIAAFVLVSCLGGIGGYAMEATVAPRAYGAEASVHRTYKGVQVPDMSIRPRTLAAANAGVVRINAGLAVSPTRHFKQVRSYAAALKSFGIRPLPMLKQNPSLTDAQWQSAVRALAQYVPAVYLEIGNEPGREGWQRYFHLARLAAPIIHAQGNRMVLAAPMNVDTLDYLKAAKAAGLFTRVDGVAIHPYAPTAFRVQERVGDARSIVPWRLPLWITEVGWGTGPNRDGGYGGLDVTASEQALYVRNLYRRLFERGKRWNLASVGYFVWKDHGPGGIPGDRVSEHSGLLRIDGTRKPSYARYAARPRVYRQG